MRLYHIEKEYNQDPARSGLCVLYLRTETEELQLITETEYPHKIKFILKKEHFSRFGNRENGKKRKKITAKERKL